MRYEVVSVVADGVLGHAVLDHEGGKFTSLNLFTEEEAYDEARRHGDAERIKRHWPEPDDREVEAIMAAPGFRKGSETLAWARNRAEEVVARKRAGL